ncbi:protocadherin-15-like [Physella acuta]|uniref:protocadherin-15-like n=1 Tax=Physella acuta TaxID=109671 RepID=UPI0027DEA129|nr:protocadherin-15-like [Physella acuta]
MDISIDNKRIVFSILEGTYRPYFVIIDTTKTDLTLVKKLDFETLPQFNITIMASDGIFNTTCILTIDVVDEDDQNPVFNASMYRGTITSDAVANSTVPINPPIFAYDPDVTLHVPVVYSFHDSGVQTTPVLEIDPQTGVVKMLEKPTGDEIYVLVQATQTDNPSRYGVALLAVTIQGNNISAPVFTKSAYNVVVTEVFPKGEVVTSVMATDSQGSPLIYYLSDPDGYFSIDPYSGDIILAQEFGIKRQFVLTVTASSGKLNSTATVTINVLPVILNQNPPRILNSVLNVTSERKKGNVLIVINASDPDEGTELSYRLLNFNNLFTINKTGAITIIAEPGDLVYSSYAITVVVSDGGQPSYETAAAVNVIFPSAVVPVAAAQIEMDTTLVIILGVLAAIFLICVVILVVYICKRRLKDKEHLDREKKARPSQQATPLAYKQKQGALGPQAMDNIFLENSDGDSGNQDNPLNGVSKGSYFNFVQDDHDTEADIHDSDIQVETSVLPFDNSALYIHSEGNDNTDNNSSIYSDYSYQPNNKNSLSPFYRNGSLSTFRGSTDSDISNTGVPSESANSKKMLLPGSLARTKLPEESGEIWERSDPTLGAIYVNDNLDADASVVPTAQKQELTVYF